MPLRALPSSSAPKATWWLQATPGVNYYRARLPARHLPGVCRKLRPTDIELTDDERPVFPRQEGAAAVWLFPGNTTRAVICRTMQGEGLRLVVESDDNYLCHPPFRISTWRERFDGTDSHSYEVFSKICGFADALTVSTPRLADIYRHLNPRIAVCRNTIDPHDWPAGEPPHQADGTLRIGWAASDSHVYDAPMIRDALEWASRQPDVEVVIFGIKPELLRWRFPYRHMPFRNNPIDYFQSLNLLDVMLCPLQAGEWQDCKSDVKALEAGMAGAAVVTSRTEPYRDWWDGTAPGIGVGDHGWRQVVKHLVRNRGEVADMAREARRHVLQHRTIQEGVRAWEEALTG